MHRVFVVGLQKTGLTSMAKALARLGYTEKKVARDITAKGGYYSNGVMQVEPGEFVCDLAPQHYWWFHKTYPNAKFILTVRHVEDWLRSLKNYWETHPRSQETAAYWVANTGLCGFNEGFHRELYRRHRMDVQAALGDKCYRFETEYEGYAELCNFLGHEFIDEPWPHENKGNYERQ